MSKIIAEIEDTPATDTTAVEEAPVASNEPSTSTAPAAPKKGQPPHPVDLKKEKARLRGIMKYYEAKEQYKTLLNLPAEEARKLAGLDAVREVAKKATPSKPAAGDAVNVAELLGLAKEKAKRKKLKNEVRGLQALIAQALADEPELAPSPAPTPEPLKIGRDQFSRTATPPRSTSPADWFGLPIGTGELKSSSRRRR